MTKIERVHGTGPRTKATDKETDKDKSQQASRSQWLVYTSANPDEPDGPFDAVIATIGTCGDPMRIGFDGMEEYESTLR